MTLTQWKEKVIYRYVHMYNVQKAEAEELAEAFVENLQACNENPLEVDPHELVDIDMLDAKSWEKYESVE